MWSNALDLHCWLPVGSLFALGLDLEFAFESGVALGLDLDIDLKFSMDFNLDFHLDFDLDTGFGLEVDPVSNWTWSLI